MEQVREPPEFLDNAREPADFADDGRGIENQNAENPIGMAAAEAVGELNQLDTTTNKAETEAFSQSSEEDEDEVLGIAEEEFQNIKGERVNERKNKNQTRRHNALKQIQNVKSKDGMDPLVLFPKEIWAKLFESVDPKDRGNAWEVHHTFQEILEPSRTRDILFPQILSVNFIPFWRNGDNQKLPAMPLAEFIQLRQVSKSARCAIYQWHEDKIIRNLHSKDDVEKASLTLRFPEPGSLKLDRILASLSDNDNIRPSFVRSLKIVFMGPTQRMNQGENLLDAFTNFRNRITHLLEIMGYHFWHFEIVMTEMYFLSKNGGVPISELYKAFIKFIKLLPNLKWLALKNPVETHEDDVPRQDYRDVTFPFLEHLERVSCLVDTAYTSNIFHMLNSALKANQHVRALNVVTRGPILRSDFFFDWRLEPLIKRMSLGLEMLGIDSKCDYYRYKWIGFSQLLFDSIGQQLKVLNLSSSCQTTMRSTIQTLGRLYNLEHLTLNLSARGLKKFERKIPFLNLPNLTHLNLNVWDQVDITDARLKVTELKLTSATNFFFSFHFLLYAKKLKQLKWKMADWEETLIKLESFLVSHEDKDKCINGRAGMRDLRSSNLWEVFPDLEFVESEIISTDRITKKSETRHMKSRRSDRF